MSDGKAIEGQIMSLIREYLSIISADHHKSRDLIFLIEKRFDGNKESIVYACSHPGYCNEWYDEFPDYRSAAQFMVTQLQDAIENERSSRNEDGELLCV